MTNYVNIERVGGMFQIVCADHNHKILAQESTITAKAARYTSRVYCSRFSAVLTSSACRLLESWCNG